MASMNKLQSREGFKESAVIVTWRFLRPVGILDDCRGVADPPMAWACDP